MNNYMLYYIIYNNTQQGPMNKEELVKYGLNYNSDVWTEGLPSWVKASEIAELKIFIDNLNAPQKAEDDYYFMIVNNQQAGPFSINELLNKGLQADKYRNFKSYSVLRLRLLLQILKRPNMRRDKMFTTISNTHLFTPIGCRGLLQALY